MNKFLYYLLNYTWGIVATIIGYIVFIFLFLCGSIYTVDWKYNGKRFWIFNRNRDYSFSIGTFVVLGEMDESSLQHEIGHSMQNAMFGPFAIILVYIPSCVRFWFRRFVSDILHKKLKKGYYDIWFESQANTLGKKWFFHTKGK